MLCTMINIEVEKNNNENNINLIKRFTRRVQGSGVLPRVRSIRYKTRKPSEYVKKKKTLKVIAYKDKMDELMKLGKIAEKVSR
jgi:hypothetical protein